MINRNIIQNEVALAISELKLDLSGFVILTEAASGIFALTPIIANLAGASHVYAIGQDSKFGSFDSIRDTIYRLAPEFGCDVSRIDIMKKSQFHAFDEVNIVTNLGNVRPLDSSFISQLNANSVISYMSEAWEYRESDIDIELCTQRGIKVAGTNENHPTVDCFKETGIIAISMAIQARVSLPKASVLIISSDHFGPRIFDSMRCICGNVHLVKDLNIIKESELSNIDLLIVADYVSNVDIIGETGFIRPSKLKLLSKNVVVLQYCGHNCIADMDAAGIEYFPKMSLESHRMAQTLADVSNRSVIRLLTGGLKVGQILICLKERGPYDSLVQPINFGLKCVD